MRLSFAIGKVVRQSPTTWKLRTAEPSNVCVRFTPEAVNMLPDCPCVLPIVAFRIAVRHSSEPATNLSARNLTAYAVQIS
jgi:hypothetical protein